MTNEASLTRVLGRPILICSPVRHALAGRIVDRETRAPIADAVVTIESWQTPPPIGGLKESRRLLHSITARTDAQGRWSVPARSDWMPGFLAADGLPFFVDSWCVTAQGYAMSVHDPWAKAGSIERNISEVALIHGNPPPLAESATRSTCGIVLQVP